MKLSYKPYALSTLAQMQKRIDPRPDYQRPLAWSNSQKQLLIDSILRGYDIPKMYWERLYDKEFKFAVIDGQQRITTLWSFFNDEFAISKDADSVDGLHIAGKKFSQLDDDLLDDFNTYQISVVIVEEARQTDEEDEIRDMFLRLQNGTTLKAQEKRNAQPGKMRDFIKELSKHNFFGKCKFTNARLTYDHVAAQMVCLEISGGPASARDNNLTRMYEQNRQFDTNSSVAKKVARVLDYLDAAFPYENTQDLERYNAINIYLLASVLLEKYVAKHVQSKIADWLSVFEQNRVENENLPEEERDLALVEYKRLTSYSTDGEESIKGRLEFIEKAFFANFPDLAQLDENRVFSSEQRLAIFKKNEGKCQLRLKCDGLDRLAWGSWHADHITPFSIGGKTTVSNGQVACPDCNFKKGASAA
jgi:hypothetical protein